MNDCYWHHLGEELKTIVILLLVYQSYIGHDYSRYKTQD